MANSSENTIERAHPLDNHLYAANNVLLKPVAARSRISLRAAAEDLATISLALGIDLPQEPKSSATKDDRIAMWLGPDEWLVLDKPESDLNELSDKLKDTNCSMVDISHRQTAILLSGNQAADVINTGCPQNLSLDVFPVGACSRTVLGKSEIVLFRTAANAFHVECWRSFSDYVWKHLVDGIKTL